MNPKILAIINLTPDSFSDGGIFLNEKKVFSYLEELQNEGCFGVDLGAVSSRPGAGFVSEDEEWQRLCPILKVCKKKFPLLKISLDTFRSSILMKGLDCGVDILNDIYALSYDSEIAPVAAKAQIPVVLMHMKGVPATMQKKVIYNDVVEEVCAFFKNRLAYAKSFGIKKCILDPGIGFGKKLSHNLSLLKTLKRLQVSDCSMMLGSSRKSFISDLKPCLPHERLGGSLASLLWGFQEGVEYFRVHDYFESQQALRVWKKIKDVK